MSVITCWPFGTGDIADYRAIYCADQNVAWTAKDDGGIKGIGGETAVSGLHYAVNRIPESGAVGRVAICIFPNIDINSIANLTAAALCNPLDIHSVEGKGEIGWGRGKAVEPQELQCLGAKEMAEPVFRTAIIQNEGHISGFCGANHRG